MKPQGPGEGPSKTRTWSGGKALSHQNLECLARHAYAFGVLFCILFFADSFVR